MSPSTGSAPPSVMPPIHDTQPTARRALQSE